MTVSDRRARWRTVMAAAASAIGVAGLGVLTTDLGPWYYGLRKPSWQPPDWLFGPAWTVIFALAALSGVLYWWRAEDRDARLQLLCGFAINAFLNTFWSLLFFRLERPDWALYEVGFLWLSIVALIVISRRKSGTAAALLIPYLLWVTFASVLNWTIVAMNAPFPGRG